MASIITLSRRMSARYAVDAKTTNHKKSDLVPAVEEHRLRRRRRHRLRALRRPRRVGHRVDVRGALRDEVRLEGARLEVVVALRGARRVSCSSRWC